MKNVLIISSSPRKNGNTNCLCEQFKKGAEDKGHHVDLVRIMEKKIGFCLACDACMKNGGKCVQKDDMAAILDLYNKADVLVLATPVYFYGISDQLKGLIDRTYPIWQHLGKIHGNQFPVHPHFGRNSYSNMHIGCSRILSNPHNLFYFRHGKITPFSAFEIILSHSGLYSYNKILK